MSSMRPPKSRPVRTSPCSFKNSYSSMAGSTHSFCLPGFFRGSFNQIMSKVLSVSMISSVLCPSSRCQIMSSSFLFNKKMQNFYLAWDFSGRLQADGWIPCSRWQHSHSIHELVDSGQEMMAVAGAVSQK